ncbi:MAG: S8 family serine peptidase, partial [Candidatus Zixiibacteriota bacterium]
YKHNDLIGNIWVNPGEDLDGDGVVYDEDDLDGVDNDGNGIVDDIIGYDFFSGFGGLTIWPGEDGGIPDSDPDDFNGHGTHVAGIAAAANNNGVDVTGAAGGWFGGHRSYRGCRIICLRIGGSAVHPTYGYEAGYINSNNAAQAIDYAVANGANVINSSWGGSSTSAAAANNAIIAGVTFCHAGGNDNSNSPDNLDNVSGMISVASVGPYSDVKSSFSNYGQWIDVSAPGSSILSTYSYHYSPTTATLDGTSMASPMVAGLALLIRSAMPSLSKNQVDSIIFNSADSISLYIANPFMQGMLGSGRIDAYQALINLPNAKFTSDVTQGQAPLTVQFTDLSPNSPVAWDWSFGTGDVASTQNPQYTYNNPGIYSVSFKENENHPLGWGEEHLRNYIWVTADTMIMDSVEGEKNSQVVVPIYLSHTEQIKQIQFAFSYQNNLGVSFDSFSVAGLRTEYFESVEFNAVDFFNKRASILMKTNVAEGSTYLKPDTGNILNLYFNISGSASEGVMTLDTVNVSGKEPKITTLWGDYWPVFTPGKIAVISGSCCIGIRGNIDGSPENPPDDPGIDIADLVYFVDFSFAQPPGPAPVCNDGTEQNPYYSEADVDGDGEVNIGDIVYMVEFMFTQPPGPEPVGCP